MINLIVLDAKVGFGELVRFGIDVAWWGIAFVVLCPIYLFKIFAIPDLGLNQT